LKFDQNRSCREREDLQLWFWAKLDLRLGSGRKTGLNSTKVDVYYACLINANDQIRIMIRN